jgi:PilZ domain
MPTARVSSDMSNALADRNPRLKSQQPSRRLASRIASPLDLWFYWHSERYGYVSRVHDLRVQGLLVETPQAIPVGETVKLNFLVEKGQIRAQAVVRHVKPGFGLGLKFTAIGVEDRPRLAALLTRIRVSSQLRDQLKQTE